jgi:hypothetical protein
MFKGFTVLSTIRFLSKPGTCPTPSQKKDKESFTEDNEGNEGVPPLLSSKGSRSFQGFVSFLNLEPAPLPHRRKTKKMSTAIVTIGTEVLFRYRKASSSEHASGFPTSNGSYERTYQRRH